MYRIRYVLYTKTNWQSIETNDAVRGEYAGIPVKKSGDRTGMPAHSPRTASLVPVNCRLVFVGFYIFLWFLYTAHISYPIHYRGGHVFSESSRKLRTQVRIYRFWKLNLRIEFLGTVQHSLRVQRTHDIEPNFSEIWLQIRTVDVPKWRRQKNVSEFVHNPLWGTCNKV